MGQDMDEFLEQVRPDDAAAHGRRLQHYRRQLQALIALRMDARLRSRVDPSDIVQETLTEAYRRLAQYIRTRPLPFDLWLRRLAIDQVVQHYRRHIRCQKRSVEREEISLSGQLGELADWLATRGSSCSAGQRQQDLRHWLHAVLARLSERDRTAIVLRNLQQLSVRDVAAILGITEAAAKVRHARALQRLRNLLEYTDP